MRFKENKNKTTVYCYRVVWDKATKHSKDIAIGKIKGVGDRTVVPPRLKVTDADTSTFEIEFVNNEDGSYILKYQLLDVRRDEECIVTVEMSGDVTDAEIGKIREYFAARQREAIKEKNLQCVKELGLSLVRAKRAIREQGYKPSEVEAALILHDFEDIEELFEEMGYARDLLEEQKERRLNRAKRRKEREEY